MCISVAHLLFNPSKTLHIGKIISACCICLPPPPELSILWPKLFGLWSCRFGMPAALGMPIGLVIPCYPLLLNHDIYHLLIGLSGHKSPAARIYFFLMFSHLGMKIDEAGIFEDSKDGQNVCQIQISILYCFCIGLDNYGLFLDTTSGNRVKRWHFWKSVIKKVN